MSYPELAYEVLSLYISDSEVPAADLKELINRSYSTFRAKEVTPLVHLEDDLYLLELFHGPSYSFKDCESSRHCAHQIPSADTTRRFAVPGESV